MTDKLRTTPIAMSVHRENDSPIFGETATHVEIDDEGGGPFIVLRQGYPSIEPGKVILDLDELETIVQVARRLIKAQQK